MKNRKPKILVVGSCVMDLIVSAERFPGSGETVLGNDFRTAPGGKGANQAVQAARLGAEVTMVGKVGSDDFGQALLSSAGDARIDTSHILTNGSFTAVGNIQLETGFGSVSNRIIVVPGANMEITAEDVAFLEKEISNYDIVILQLEIPMQINTIVARYAKAAGVPVMLNSAPYAPIPAQLLSALDYISPNEHEAALLTGMSVDTDADVEAALKKIRAMGVKNALITLGERGAAFLDASGSMILSPSVSGTHAVDPTAAGDSFVGAFCTAVCLDLGMEEALCFANHTASITVSRMGAQPSLPEVGQVLELMQSRGFATGDFEILTK